MRPPRLLLLGLGLQHRPTLGDLPCELVVWPRPIGQLLVVQMQDAGHRAVQQPPVVADDQHGVGVFGQIAFQPQRAFKVEVVGRLVQQQVVRLRKQHPRQRHPHPPAARKIRTGPLLRLFVKPQPLQDGRGAALGGPRVDVGQAGLNFRDPVRVGRNFGLRQQGGAFGVRFQHRVDQRGRRRRHLLRHAADPGARGDRDVAPLQRQLLADQPEQRGLARAVAPDKANLVAGGNGGRRPFEQGAAFDGIGDVFDFQHGAGVPYGGQKVNRIGVRRDCTTSCAKPYVTHTRRRPDAYPAFTPLRLHNPVVAC